MILNITLPLRAVTAVDEVSVSLSSMSRCHHSYFHTKQKTTHFRAGALCVTFPTQTWPSLGWHCISTHWDTGTHGAWLAPSSILPSLGTNSLIIGVNTTSFHNINRESLVILSTTAPSTPSSLTTHPPRAPRPSLTHVRPDEGHVFARSRWDFEKERGTDNPRRNNTSTATFGLASWPSLAPSLLYLFARRGCRLSQRRISAAIFSGIRSSFVRSNLEIASALGLWASGY